MHIKEILLKEEEKHRLKFIGIIDDWDHVITLTQKTFVCPDSSFIQNKARLLDFFYSSIIDYQTFINKEKISNANLKQHHFQKTRAYTSNLSNGIKADLDMELKTPAGITFSWHFSNIIFNQMYHSFCLNAQIFRMPQETDLFFVDESKKLYPLTIDQVIGYLNMDDPSFWNVCAKYLQELSRTVVSYSLQRGNNYTFADVIKSQTWMDAYQVLRTRLIEKQGNIPVFKNGRDLRNYLIKTCKFIASNLQRKYVRKYDYIEDLPNLKSNNDDDDLEEEVPFFAEEENHNTEIDREIYDLDINTDNPYEVAHAISIILLNSNHPYHQSLINGIQDKVRILIDKASNEMSYHDIVSEQYAEKNLGQKEFHRAIVKARKDYERVRKTLCDRLIHLVNKKTGSGCHNSTFSPII